MRAFPAAKSTASRRGRALAPVLAPVLLAVLTAAAAPGCKLNQQGVAPPLDRIAFPGSALVDPDGKWLYVANSNSDLRYNSGTLVAVDLETAARDRFGEPAKNWQVCPGADRVRVDTDEAACCWDYLDHEVLNCDERLYIPPDSTVEIGSFSAGMAFQSFEEPKCAAAGNDSRALKMAATNRHDCSTSCPSEPTNGRLFIAVRGNSSLTYVDTGRVFDRGLQVDSGAPGEDIGRFRPTFSCSDAKSSNKQVCQVTFTPTGASPGSTATPIHVPDEPYALALDEQQDLLYVGNLRGDTGHPQTGGISLFDVSRPDPRSVPTFIGPSSAFFAPDANGNFGITSLTPRNGQVYATSRYGTSVVNVAPTLDPLPPTRDNICFQSLDTISLYGGGDVFTTPLLGAEVRGIQFLPEGNRAFVLQRNPPALVGFDISTDPRAYGNFPSDVIETCAGPTFLQSYDAGKGEGTRLYVTCFDAGQIYVFDPYVPRLIAVIDAGRGPAGIAFPKQQLQTDRALAYVVGFAANDIPVIDLTPRSETQYHVVQRIGFPSLVPR